MSAADGSPPAAMNNVYAAIVVTMLFALALLLFPTGDGSYSCDRPPVTLLLSPEAENALLRQDFFDEGYQCNHDARRRGAEGLAVLVVGGLLTMTLRRQQVRARRR